MHHLQLSVCEKVSEKKKSLIVLRHVFFRSVIILFHTVNLIYVERTAFNLLINLIFEYIHLHHILCCALCGLGINCSRASALLPISLPKTS